MCSILTRGNCKEIKETGRDGVDVAHCFPISCPFFSSPLFQSHTHTHSHTQSHTHTHRVTHTHTCALTVHTPSHFLLSHGLRILWTFPLPHPRPGLLPPPPLLLPGPEVRADEGDLVLKAADGARVRIGSDNVATMADVDSVRRALDRRLHNSGINKELALSLGHAGLCTACAAPACCFASPRRPRATPVDGLSSLSLTDGARLADLVHPRLAPALSRSARMHRMQTRSPRTSP